MSTNSKIEWTEASWPVTTGCTAVSAGCDHCYAATLTAGRLRNQPAYAGLATKVKGQPAEFTGEVRCHPDRLDWPLHWRKPRRVFVNSMSDLFHDSVPEEFIARVFAVMAACPQHTFQVLTKRHARMRSLLSSKEFIEQVQVEHDDLDDECETVLGRSLPCPGPWPLPNVWLGVSVEDQRWADIRIPPLLDTPAAVRFLSCEPLLGPVDLRRWLGDYVTESMAGDAGESAMAGTFYPFGDIHWLICGGESGHGARPMHPDWARSLRNQCVVAGVPFFFKQWGEWQDGSAAPGQRGTDHVIVADGRHEPWDGHTRDGGMPATDLAHARLCHERGTDRAVVISRVGKKTAGRELDGRTWDEYPAGVR